MNNSISSKIVFCLSILSIAGQLLGATGELASGERQPSLNELLDIPFNWSVVPESSRSPNELDTAVDPAVDRRLTGKEATNLFEQALEMMGDASQRLGAQRDPGIRTQRVQEATLKKLDQVIAEAERRCQAGPGSGSPGQPEKTESGSDGNVRDGRSSSDGQPSNLAHQGGASPGHVKRVDPARPIEQHRREWGHLPPRLRDELQQGLGEPYSPLYQSLTEAYFRRLAQIGE